MNLMHSKRGPGIGLSLLVLASLVLHLGYLHSPLAVRNFLPMDEGIYWDLADHVSREGTLALSVPAFATAGAEERTLFWTPVYPILLSLILKTSLALKTSLVLKTGLVSKSGVSPLRLLQLLQILLVACVPLLLYPIAGRFLQGKRLWAFLLFASLYPYTFQLATQAGSETTALFLSLAALSLAFVPAWKSLPSLFLLGTLSAWLCLDRPEYLIFSLVLLAWIAARLLREGGSMAIGASDRRAAFRLAARRIAILSLSFAVWMGAWVYRNFQVTDGIAFTTRSGYSLAYQNEYYLLYSRGEVESEAEWTSGFPAFPTEIKRYGYLKERAGDFIRSHPLVYAQLCAKRLISFFLPQEAKSWIYRVMKKRDLKSEGMAHGLPGWFRFSNWVFLGGLWFLALPGAGLVLGRCVKRKGWKSWKGSPFAFLNFWKSHAGLLLLLILGQMAIYTFFAYIEYQRSILDLEVLLLGCCFLANPQTGLQKPQNNG